LPRKQNYYEGEDDFESGNYFITFDDNYYTDGKNCENTYPDEQHQVFYAPLVGQVANAKTFVEPGKWYTLTYTSNGSSCALYINCRLAARGSSAGKVFSNSYDLFFGKMNHWKFPYWYHGVLDEVRLYNRALTKQEIGELCGQPKPAPKPLPKQQPKQKPLAAAAEPNLLKLPAATEKALLLKEDEVVVAAKGEFAPPQNVYRQRFQDVIETIEVNTDSVLVELYDNGQIDGDSVSVYFNEKLLVSRKGLTAAPIRLGLLLDSRRAENTFTMYAENLGEIPPNTALMIVTYGNIRKEIFIQSTEKSNGVVIFKQQQLTK
jgi:hypothetical protein